MGILKFIIDSITAAAGMNLDSAYAYFKSGQTLNNLNIRHTTEQGSTGNDAQNIRGSELKFTLEDVEAQDQNTRFYFIIDGVNYQTFTVQIFDWNNTPLTAAVTYTTDPTSITNTLNNFITAISAALTTGNQTFSVGSTPVSTTEGFVDLVITGTIAPAEAILGRGIIVRYTYITATILTGVDTTTPLNDNEAFTSTGGVTGFIGHDSGTGTMTIYGLNQIILAGDVITGTGSGRVFTVTTVDGTVTTTEEDFYWVITDEAIDISIAGSPICIGSRDILGRLYSFWSPQINMPVDIAEDNPIVSITDNGAGLIRITFTTDQAMTSGEAISISNIATTAGVINGFWIVDVVTNSPLTIDLLGSDFTTLTVTDFSEAIVTRYPFGYGMIHAAERSENTQIYNAQVLLRTKELNFRVPKQIDCDGDLNNKYEIYFTDFYNTLRCFYYTGPIIFDGALHVVVPQGEYAYGSIDLATQLIVAQPKIELSFTNQLQTGGNIPAGNHRTAVRLITRSGNTPTLWTALDNDVPVYQYPFNEASCEYVVGSVSQTFTTKINQFQVTGINTDVYKYLELADVLYSGKAVSAIIVTRYVITNPTMNIQYTGYENDTTKLDVAELSRIQAAYKTARNIRIIDNRLVISCLTVDTPYDLTDWAQTIEHELFKHAIDEAPDPIGNSAGFFQPEYASPNNVNEFMGYMMNDNYRFAVQVRSKATGVWSDSYHVQDITFNTDAAYPRRIAAFADYDLTDTLVIATAGVNRSAGAAQVLVPAIKFVYDVNFVLPDGKRLGDVIDGVRFVRCECVPEVQASGWIVPAIFQYATGVVNGGSAFYGVSDDVLKLWYGEYPLWMGWLVPALDPGTKTNFDFLGSDPAFPGVFTQDANSRKLCSFYSPDILFGQKEFTNSFQSADSLLVMAALAPNDSVHHAQSAPYQIASNFKFTDMARTGATAVPYAITDAGFCPTGGQITINSLTYSKAIYGFAQAPSSAGLDSFIWNVMGTPVFMTTSDIASPFSIMYAQWYRAIANKYGNASNSIYRTTGHEREISSTDTGTLTDEVFGGDTFTQHVYLKPNTPQQWWFGGAGQYDGALQPASTQGGNSAVKTYTQNRINAQLRTNTLGGIYTTFPNDYDGPILGSNDFSVKEDAFVEGLGIDDLTYDESYNIGLAPVTYIGFDPLLERITDYFARIAWSILKPQGSLTDLFREFKPLDFHDLESKFGAITHHEIVNGELLTLQPRKWMRQFFNTRGVLEARGIGEILIGDGSVMSRDGIQLSSIGSRNKWSVIKGRAKGGSDTLYWISADYKKAMRFGANGSVSISDDQDMQSFFANNLRFIYDYDTPALNYGISGVWDDRYNEIVWTVMGEKQLNFVFDPEVSYGLYAEVFFTPTTLLEYLVSTGTLTDNEPFTSVNGVTGFVGHDNTADGEITVYNLNKEFEVGDVVTGDNSGFSITITAITDPVYSTYNKTGEIYISKVASNLGNVPDLSSDEWELVPHQNALPFPTALVNGKYSNDYYNEYTIAFGESRNTFHSFYTPKPKIYLKYLDIYLAPDPVHQSKVYQFDTGDWCKWFDGNDEDGYVYLVFSKNNNEVKMYGALEFNTLIVPAGVRQYTEAHETYMLVSDFEDINGMYAVATRNDILTSSTLSNEDDTSKLWGEYTIIKLPFEKGVFQKMTNVIIKYVPLARDYRS